MAFYQFYRLGAAGEILAAAEYCECPGDVEAQIGAAALVGDHAAVEIWLGRRLVGRVALDR